MGLIRVVYTLNVIVTFAAGSPICVFLLWLIVKHTPDVMRSYRRILLQACIIDLTILVAQTIVQPMLFVDGNGVTTQVLVSPLVSWCPLPWNIILLNSWLFVTFVCNLQYGLLFIYRWLVVTRTYTLPFAVYMSLLLVPSAIQTYLQWISEFNTNASATMPNISAWIGDELEIGTWPRPMRHSDSTFTIGVRTIVMAYATLTILVVVVFAVKTSRFVRKNLQGQKGQKAQRNLDLNNQLNRMLVVQAFAGFLFAYLPVFIVNLMSTLTRGPSQNDQMIWVLNVSIILDFWVPVVNAVVAICCITPYRRLVLQRAYRWRFSLLKQFSRAAITPSPMVVVGGGGNNNNNMNNTSGNALSSVAASRMLCNK